MTSFFLQLLESLPVTTLLLIAVVFLLRFTFSAAHKHQLLVSTFVLLLLVPLIQGAVPKWRILPRFEAGKVVEGGKVVSGELGEAWLWFNEQFSIVTIMVVLWLLGAVVSLLKTLLGELYLRRLVKGAGRACDDRVEEIAREVRVRLGVSKKVMVRMSPIVEMPLVCGWFQSVVLIPERARQWTRGEMESVLLHEFSHVARRDIAANLLRRLSIAVYWFHPLVLRLAHLQKLVREMACDDHVILSGQADRTYASHLADLVTGRQLRLDEGTASNFNARSSLHRRLGSILNSEQARSQIKIGDVFFCGTPLLLLSLLMVSLGFKAAGEVQSDVLSERDGRVHESEVFSIWDDVLAPLIDSEAEVQPREELVEVALPGNLESAGVVSPGEEMADEMAQIPEPMIAFSEEVVPTMEPPRLISNFSEEGVSEDDFEEQVIEESSVRFSSEMTEGNRGMGFWIGPRIRFPSLVPRSPSGSGDEGLVPDLVAAEEGGFVGDFGEATLVSESQSVEVALNGLEFDDGEADDFVGGDLSEILQSLDDELGRGGELFLDIAEEGVALTNADVADFTGLGLDSKTSGEELDSISERLASHEVVPLESEQFVVSNGKSVRLAALALPSEVFEEKWDKNVGDSAEFARLVGGSGDLGLEFNASLESSVSESQFMEMKEELDHLPSSSFQDFLMGDSDDVLEFFAIEDVRGDEIASEEVELMSEVSDSDLLVVGVEEAEVIQPNLRPFFMTDESGQRYFAVESIIPRHFESHRFELQLSYDLKNWRRALNSDVYSQREKISAGEDRLRFCMHRPVSEQAVYFRFVSQDAREPEGLGL